MLIKTHGHVSVAKDAWHTHVLFTQPIKLLISISHSSKNTGLISTKLLCSHISTIYTLL